MRLMGSGIWCLHWSMRGESAMVLCAAGAFVVCCAATAVMLVLAMI